MTDIRKAAAAMGRKGGKSKSPAKLAGIAENRKKAIEACKKRNSLPLLRQ